jgi:homoserine O-acetyltransferase
MPHTSDSSSRETTRGTTRGPLAVAATLLIATSVVPAVVAQAPGSPPPRTVPLGTCHLSAGTPLPECRVAYRAYGRLSTARDNVILIPTFFAGRSEDHRFMLGTYVDTTRYHVVVVDALADGYSSSPSNTPAGAAAFTGLTIGDMVDVQHRFLTEGLGIRHVRAVVGISMGGFQALEWAVRHPTFMDAAVSIVGSPRPTPYDRLIFDTWRRSAEALDGPHADPDSAWMQASRLETLFMRTARFVNDSGDAHRDRSVREMAAAYGASWHFADYAAQLLAIAAHDVSARFGGDMTRAADAVRARLLLVWSPDDALVDPGPAAAFARLVRADTLAVPSSCGHAVFWCEPERIGRAVRTFIDRAPDVAAARVPVPTPRAAPRSAGSTAPAARGRAPRADRPPS